ncbi:phosphatase PAP2 family protein [Tissierella sp. MSJ-40]|uniref:Phosphatase PAP2 family protein n=1 Tax=Tissierella simiarum TaxID=2841534 RepID=A0ABS6E5V1_9FIRM|nr:phosphatase PAP2 family protein [Tissierella simiarum]MBU5437800.1 phosphatase PAP2 family protein [Tissierella simiarum]
MRKGLKWFDDKLISLINDKMKNRFLDLFMYRITDLGGAIFSTLFLISLVFFGSKRMKLIGLEGLTILSISQIIVHTLKKLLSRERPYKILENLNTFGINMKDYSFPSGHTTASFSIATTIALNMPKLSIVALFLAMIIGISRIYLAVHYPTDVAAGIILGVSTAIIVHLYLLNYIERIAEIIGLN